MTPLITTGRLELRPFRDQDAAELHEIFSDPETHTIGEGPFTSLAQTAAWISRRAETERQHGLLWYAVRARADGRLLGNCGLFAGRTGSAEPEIGYEIRRSCQGQGLATEAAAAVLDDALAGGISRVWATIRPHNTASLRVAAKIGMTPQHTRPDSRGPLIYLARPLQAREGHAGTNAEALPDRLGFSRGEREQIVQLRRLFAALWAASSACSRAPGERRRQGSPWPARTLSGAVCSWDRGLIC